MPKVNFCSSIFLICFSFLSVRADDVVLKNLKVIENVKAKISTESVTVLYNNSKSLHYPKNQVKSIRLKPIIKNSVNEADRMENEKEKIRVSEALQNLTGIEIPQDQKLKIAVLNFKTSKNIPKEEADLIIQIITTGLVKTKLFVIVDPILVSKTMNEQGGTGCEENPADCRIPANTIAKSLSVSKVLTGTINKIQNKYYINGNIIDVHSSNIDFAETSKADSFDQIQQTSENFSKKVAGGIASVSNTSVSLDETPSRLQSNLSYGWRSAVVPGWGQFADGRKLKSLTVFSLFAAALAYEADSISRYQHSKAAYSNVITPFAINTALANSNQAGAGFLINYHSSQSRRQELDSAAANVGIGVGLISAVYLYGIFDAYFFANPKNVSIGQEKGYHLSVNAAPASSAFGQKETQYSLSIQGWF